MEFMLYGDLEQYIDDTAPLPESEGSLIAKQIAIGLRHMHQKGFLHRDLKPLLGMSAYHPPPSQITTGFPAIHLLLKSNTAVKSKNILVDTPGPEWKVKLADFGIARNIAGPTLYTHYIGTYGYISLPSYSHHRDAYTVAVDI